jgi:carbohydrate-selective porin OprB
VRAIAFVCLATSTAYADLPAPDPCACSPNKPGFHRADALTGDWGGVRKDWGDDGFKIQPSYAWEVFTAPELGDDSIVTAGLASLVVDLELGKLASKKLGSFHVQGFGIHGRNLSQRLMDVFTVSNNSADRDLRVYEAYYDQPIGPVTIRAGVLAADQQFTLANTSVVLLNATFGVIGITSYNIVKPTYPIGALGVAITTETGPVTTTLALYDGDNPNSHGLPSAIGDNALVMGELEIAGTFKLGTWRHTALGSGYYGVLQRQLERHLAVFARVGVSPDAAGMSFYADTGIRIGPGPLRPKDFFSAGLVHADTTVGSQTLVELTYQYLVKGWLTLQPDVQLLLDRTGTVGIAAVRGVVVF